MESNGSEAAKNGKGGGIKRLACFNCRNRRKKCDLEFPCGNCSKLKLECNVNVNDMRKKRHSLAYIKFLEEQVDHLQKSVNGFIRSFGANGPPSGSPGNLIGGDVTDGEKMLPSSSGGIANASSIPVVVSTFNELGVPVKNEFSSNADLANLGANSIAMAKSNSGTKRKKVLVGGSVYPEGPVGYRPKEDGKFVTISPLLSNSSLSASPNLEFRYTNSPSPVNGKERISDLKTTVIMRPIDTKNFGTLNTDLMVLESLSNFYRWLYPGLFIFVHRESFLYGFFNHADDDYKDSSYCSVELVLAMCAIGSRLSPNVRHMSDTFYEKSKEALLKIIFDEGSPARITTVQALFCLAFYELGKGDNKLAWYFSGLAIRVGYEMGFHLDPKVWATEDSNIEPTQSELDIRSRIYWGCYVADHFICLTLGGTSTLNVSNSTVPESDELPEVDGTEEFKFMSKQVLQVSLPLKNLIVLSRIVQVFTSKIFIELEDSSARIPYLSNFNAQVFNWKQSLPKFMQWTRESINDPEISTDPTLTYYWYHYYIVRLTFNKPFIEEYDESRYIVLEILQNLKMLFSNFGNRFGTFDTFNLTQVYACLLAVKCCKKFKAVAKEVSGKNSGRQTPLEKQPAFMMYDWQKELDFFDDIFYSRLAPAYNLPIKLQQQSDIEVGEERHDMSEIGNFNYIHDFSLSNKIDDMIRDLFDENYSMNQNGALPTII